ncbi:MAG: hypothetical protein IIA41_15495, partial [SAR324 cluster bacterium]|nr:hypothetical protein [SAR324 cluster bacterium]
MVAQPQINDHLAAPIRHATLNDLADMDRIEQESFSTPWSRELLRGAIYNMRYDVRIVRPRQRHVLGFSIAHTVQRRSNLDNLAVERRERHRGLGRRLIDDSSDGQPGRVDTHNVVDVFQVDPQWTVGGKRNRDGDRAGLIGQLLLGMGCHGQRHVKSRAVRHLRQNSVHRRRHQVNPSAGQGGLLQLAGLFFAGGLER